MVHLGRIHGLNAAKDTAASSASAQRLRLGDWKMGFKPGEEPDNLQHLSVLQRQLVSKAFQTNAFEAKLKARDTEEERSTTANEVLQQALRSHAASVASLYMDSSTGPLNMQRLPKRSLGRFQYEDTGHSGIEDSRSSSADWDEECPQSQRRHIHYHTASGYLEAGGSMPASSSPGTSPRSRISRHNRLLYLIPPRSNTLSKRHSGGLLAARLPPMACIGRQNSGDTADSTSDDAAAEATAAGRGFKRASSCLTRADQLLMALRGSPAVVPAPPGGQPAPQDPAPQTQHNRHLFPSPLRLQTAFQSGPRSSDAHRRQAGGGGGGGAAASAAHAPRPLAAAQATAPDSGGPRTYLQCTGASCIIAGDASKRQDRAEYPAASGAPSGSWPPHGAPALRLAPAPPPGPQRAPGGIKVVAQAARAGEGAGESAPAGDAGSAADDADSDGDEELVLVPSGTFSTMTRQLDAAAAAAAAATHPGDSAAAARGGDAVSEGGDAVSEGSGEVRPSSRPTAGSGGGSDAGTLLLLPKPPLPPRSVSWWPAEGEADGGGAQFRMASALHPVAPAESLFTRVSRSSVRNAQQQQWVSTYEPLPPHQQRSGPSVFMAASCGASPYATLAARDADGAGPPVVAGGGGFLRHSTASIYHQPQDIARRGPGENGTRLPPLPDGYSSGGAVGGSDAGGGRGTAKKGRVMASLSCSAAEGAMIASKLRARPMRHTAIPAAAVTAAGAGSGSGVDPSLSPDPGSGNGFLLAPEAMRPISPVELAANAAAAEGGTVGAGRGSCSSKGREPGVHSAGRRRGASMSEEGSGNGSVSFGGSVRIAAVQSWQDGGGRGSDGGSGGGGPVRAGGSPAVASRVRRALGQLLTRGGPSP